MSGKEREKEKEEEEEEDGVCVKIHFHAGGSFKVYCEAGWTFEQFLKQVKEDIGCEGKLRLNDMQTKEKVTEIAAVKARGELIASCVVLLLFLFICLFHLFLRAIQFSICSNLFELVSHPSHFFLSASPTVNQPRVCVSNGEHRALMPFTKSLPFDTFKNHVADALSINQPFNLTVDGFKFNNVKAFKDGDMVMATVMDVAPSVNPRIDPNLPTRGSNNPTDMAPSNSPSSSSTSGDPNGECYSSGVAG